jgi:integrase
VTKSRRRGKYWSARWQNSDGSDAEKGGFLTSGEADVYGKEQVAIESRRKLEKKFERRSKNSITLHEYVVESWALTLQVKKSTLRDYETNLNAHILPKFGSFKLMEITPEEIERWLKEMADSRQADGTKYSPRTLEKIENLLATILKKAFLNKKLAENPFLLVSRHRGTGVKKREIKPLEFVQVKSIAEKMPENLRLLVWLGFFTGFRPSEMLGLTFDHIDFRAKTIKLDRQLSREPDAVFDPELKSAASYRTISLSASLEEMVLEHRRKYGLGPHDLLFRNRDGAVLRYKAASYAFNNAIQVLEIAPRTGLHVLRHTCVSNLIRQGVNIKQIQRWVGHNSIEETLNTYGHLFEDDMALVGNKLDELYLEKLQPLSKVHIQSA